MYASALHIYLCIVSSTLASKHMESSKVYFSSTIICEGKNLNILVEYICYSQFVVLEFGKISKVDNSN